VASASYMVLEELLTRGHHVEFHAIGGFVEPEGLIGRPGFTYVPTTIRPVRAGWRAIEAVVPQQRRGAPMLGYSLVSNALHERAIARVLARRHAETPFDALLVLGTLAAFRAPGLPCVSWPQGPPDAEWQALQANRAQTVKYSGRALFEALRILYAHKRRVCRRQLPFSDILVGCSRWSADAWVRSGAAPDRVRAVPYPYDLDALRPLGRIEESPRVTRFLWLGRIVPRKRLDLMIDAFRALRAERPDVELWIIGQVAYPKGLRRLLDEARAIPGVTHKPFVPRAELPELFRRVDVVVQPSENENLGSAVLEGICCGVPAIVGPSHGSKDYLGNSSLVFDAYTSESLKTAMAGMADSLATDRAALATEARASAERFLSIRMVTSQIVDAIHDAMTPSPTRGF
jgi:glycosyltransferase involved in cell wall biosynthesis